MKTNDFFNTLLDKTKDIPESKLEEIISYYKKEISAGISSGKSEEEIINNFGDINLIVSNIKNDCNESFSDDSSSCNSILSKNNTGKIKLTTSIKKLSDSIDCNVNHDIYNIDLTHNKNLSKRINKCFKIIVAVLIMIVIIPLIAAISAFVIGLFGLSFGIFIGSIGILIDNLFSNFANTPNLPLFIAHFPKNALIFLSLGSISLSGLAILFLTYTSKFLLMLIGRFFAKYKRKGGI